MYEYRIEPHRGKIVAEVYKIWHLEALSKIQGKPVNTEIHLIKKEFGGMFRQPEDQDYIEAKKWAEDHLKSIYHANK